MIIGLLGALACAVAYGVATVLQAVGARRTATADGFDPRLLVRLVGSLPYLAGLALDGVGFATEWVALRTLPLFVVQACVASSVGVTALVAVRWMGARLSRAEVVGLATLGLGLVLLAVSAQSEEARPLSATQAWLVLAGVVPVAALVVAAGRLAPRIAVPVLATAAGLGFGGVGIAARTLPLPDPWWHVLGSPLLWAMVAYAVVALQAYAAALQRGTTTTVAAVTFTVETVVPAIIGLAMLGDSPRPGFGLVATIGFVFAVASAVRLARLAEPPAPAVAAVPTPEAPPEPA